MPNRKTHNDFSKILFGESASEVHKFMDAPVKQLGRNHRKSRHDLRTVGFLYAAKGKKAAQHALGHILLDKSTPPSETTAKKLVNNGILPVLKKIKQIRGLKLNV